MIEIRNLNLNVGEHEVSSLSKVIYKEGNLHFIKGPSGAGKTTFLYVLGMISSQKNYDYYFCNKKVSSSKDKEKIKKSEIGFLYQNFNIQKELTLYENMKLFRLIKYKSLSKKRAKSLLSNVGLNKKITEKTSNLSGGELQRFCLACILAKNPSVIIADEPTSALDKKNAEHIMRVLKDLATNLNKIVIVATHSHDYDRLANTIDIIEENKLKRIKNEVNERQIPTNSRFKSKINLSFFGELFRSRLKIKAKKQLLPIILSLTILSICTYLSSFCDVVQDEYKQLMEDKQTTEVYLVPKTKSFLNSSQQEEIQQFRYVDSVVQIKKYFNATIIIDGKSYNDIEVYPIYSFQSSYGGNTVLVGSWLSEYIHQSCTLTINQSSYALTIIDEMPLPLVSLYNATKKSVYVPYEILENIEGIDTGTFVISYERMSHFDVLSAKIAQMDIAYDIYNPYLNMQNALLSLYSQIDIITYSTYILYAISFALLLFINFQDIFSKRKELSLYQANGVSRKEVFLLELIENGIRMVIYLLILYLLNYIYIQLGNQYILNQLILIKYTKDMVKSILILVVIFDFIPRFVSLCWMLNLSLENELRSN